MRDVVATERMTSSTAAKPSPRTAERAPASAAKPIAMPIVVESTTETGTGDSAAARRAELTVDDSWAAA